MDISVITPAHDEGKLIGKCLRSVQSAVGQITGNVEHIVVVNRCTDETESIALAGGGRIVDEHAKNLSRIRNAGAALAEGDSLVTIEADSWMSDNMLSEVVRPLDTGRFVGGGVRTLPSVGRSASSAA